MHILGFRNKKAIYPSLWYRYPAAWSFGNESVSSPSRVSSARSAAAAGTRFHLTPDRRG